MLVRTWRKWNPCTPLVGMGNVADTVETVWMLLKKIKIRTTIYDLKIPLLGIYPKELRSASRRDISIPTFTAALFIIAKVRKQSKCLLTDEWINKMWCIHTVKYYYSTWKRKDILQFVTWMKLEAIMLSEISQWQKKTSTAWLHCMRYLKESNALHQRAQWWLPMARRQGMGNY